MNTMSEQINELMGALAKAQGRILPAMKDNANPFFKSKYADLASVWNACRAPLSENGLAIVQTVQNGPGGLSLHTMLGHASGQWIKSEMPIELIKKDPQTLGSTITYYRRYALSAIVGVAPDDDDDGEKAQASYRNPPKPPKKEENPFEAKRLASEFSKNFSGEDPDLIVSYLEKYAGHWKKSIKESIDDYQDEEKFKSDFTKWRIKEENKAG